MKKRRHTTSDEKAEAAKNTKPMTALVPPNSLLYRDIESFAVSEYMLDRLNQFLADRFSGSFPADRISVATAVLKIASRGIDSFL
ncbi:hypothetical protein EVAR_76755_1 [Eumeta japonica]|uniref:Uncharacterized protein n=1 Tax=Eumeta variegata TaxID=151549 RepID=A0A4C1SVT9_EUMVA|nr:hypothetical protein EVAR_76755_1 [Eumeta japonica]